MSAGRRQPQEKEDGKNEGSERQERASSQGTRGRLAGSVSGARLGDPSLTMSHRDHFRSKCSETGGARGSRREPGKSLSIVVAAARGQKKKKKTHGVVRCGNADRGGALLLQRLPEMRGSRRRRRAHGDSGSSAEDVERSHGVCLREDGREGNRPKRERGKEENKRKKKKSLAGKAPLTSTLSLSWNSFLFSTPTEFWRRKGASSLSLSASLSLFKDARVVGLLGEGTFVAQLLLVVLLFCASDLCGRRHSSFFFDTSVETSSSTSTTHQIARCRLPRRSRLAPRRRRRRGRRRADEADQVEARRRDPVRGRKRTD